MLRVFLFSGLFVLLSCGQAQPKKFEVENEANAAPVIQQPVVREQTSEEKDQELGNFIYTLMDIVKAELTPTKRQLTARTIIRVVNDIMETKEQKQQFVVLLALESRFSNNAKSHAGAVGISQLMPQYTKNFAGKCGMTDIVADDIGELEINLYLGACLFRSLLESPKIKGNVALALVSYNAGMSSAAFGEITGMRNITNTETANYVSKFTFLKEEVKKALNDKKEEK